MADAKQVDWKVFEGDCTSVLSIDVGGLREDPWVYVYGYGRTHDFMAAEVPHTVKLMLAAARAAERKLVLKNVARVMKTGE